MTDTIQDLRSELFATLRALRDKENPMDIARAEAVAHVAQTIINTAKTEIDHMKIVGADVPSPFIALDDQGGRPAISSTPTGTLHATPTGVVHRMR